MNNPWKNIPAADYESHMSSPSVGQLKVLSEIFRLQYQRYNPKSISIFGICTGNGLEHIDPKVTRNVYGIDVNSEYLRHCKERFSNRGYTLHLVETDVNETTVQFPPCDLIVANLFLEYVDLDKFLEQINILSHSSTVISAVVQINNTQVFVSKTEFKSLEALSGFHHDIEPDGFIDEMKRHQYKFLFKERYPALNGKELVRLDFSV